MRASPAGSATLVAGAASGPAWPTAVLLFSASLWGLSWWPLKGFAAVGLSGPMLSLLTYGVVGLAASVLLVRDWPAWRAQAHLLAALALIGGWANTAFVNALMSGEVARVMFLFYLAPVWSVLGGRIFLGERIRPRRALAVAIALVGLWQVMGGRQALAAPLSGVDLLAVSAGLAFAGNNIVARLGQSIPMTSKTVAVFVGCGVLSAIAVVQQGAQLPGLTPAVGLALLAYGAGWLVLVTATWQYGVTHLESGRAGVVMVAELVVAVVSAELLGEQTLTAAEWLGGALIAAAAVLEATDTGGTVDKRV